MSSSKKTKGIDTSKETAAGTKTQAVFPMLAWHTEAIVQVVASSGEVPRLLAHYLFLPGAAGNVPWP